MVRHTLHLKNGNTSMRLRVKFDSAAHVERFCTLSAKVFSAEKRMKELGSTEACDQYGAAIMALYELVLGTEEARGVERWFGQNVLGMVSQINPFIRQKVMPDVEKCSAVNRERMRRKFVKQQKRAMRQSHATE